MKGARPTWKRVGFYLTLACLILGVMRGIDFVASYFYAPIETFGGPPPGVQTRARGHEWDYEIKTNSLGLRSPEVDPDDDAPITLFLGDSFVFGLGVDARDAFVTKVGVLLNERGLKTRALNAGVVDYGPPDSLRLFRKLRSRALKPRVVVLCIYANDVYDSGLRSPYRDARERSRKKLLVNIAFLIAPYTTEQIFRLRYVERNAARYRLQPGTPDGDSPAAADTSPGAARPALSPEVFLNAVMSYAKKRGVTHERARAWQERLGPEILELAARGDISFVHVVGGLTLPSYYEQGLDLTAEGLPKLQRMLDAMRAIHQEARAAEAEFALVYVPSELQFDARKQELNRRFGFRVHESWLRETSRLEVELSRFARDHAIPFLNLTPAFRRDAGRGLVFRYDLHWNERGHELAAQNISRFLAEQFAEHFAARLEPTGR